MSKHNTEGPPCAHMEQLLQAAADDSLRGIRKWYAVAHAARCFRCGNFLHRMRMTVEALRSAQSTIEPDRIARIKSASKKGPE